MESKSFNPLPAMPAPGDSEGNSTNDNLLLTHGRTFTHFHSFYDNGRALPTLAARETHPQLWMSPADAKQRRIENGASIEISNHQGTFSATAKVTSNIQDGVVWMRDGWPGMNVLTNGNSILPESALAEFPFSVGQADFGASVVVESSVKGN